MSRPRGAWPSRFPGHLDSDEEFVFISEKTDEVLAAALETREGQELSRAARALYQPLRSHGASPLLAGSVVTGIVGANVAHFARRENKEAQDALLDLEWTLGFDEGVVRATELLKREALLPPSLLKQVLALTHPDRHPGREERANKVTAELVARLGNLSDKRKLVGKLSALEAPPRPDRAKHPYPETPQVESERP